ncbi:MAG: hypothetical protein PHG18_05055 [Bacilli bacterium]|nr:hypothetical protein [Bacilli bacterium]
METKKIMVRSNFGTFIRRQLTGDILNLDKGQVEEIEILWTTKTNICFRFTKKEHDDHIGRIIGLKDFEKFFQEVDTEEEL